MSANVNDLWPRLSAEMKYCGATHPLRGSGHSRPLRIGVRLRLRADDIRPYRGGGLPPPLSRSPSLKEGGVLRAQGVVRGLAILHNIFVNLCIKAYF